MCWLFCFAASNGLRDMPLRFCVPQGLASPFGLLAFDAPNPSKLCRCGAAPLFIPHNGLEQITVNLNYGVHAQHILAAAADNSVLQRSVVTNLWRREPRPNSRVSRDIYTLPDLWWANAEHEQELFTKQVASMLQPCA